MHVTQFSHADIQPHTPHTYINAIKPTHIYMCIYISVLNGLSLDIYGSVRG